MTKTYAIEILENTRMQLLDQLDLLNVLAIGDLNENRKELTEKLDNVKASIKTLNENLGIVFATESGAIIYDNGDVKFAGNLTLSTTKPKIEQSVTQNITFNVESPKDFDIAKFTEQIIKSLRRERGVR